MSVSGAREWNQRCEWLQFEANIAFTESEANLRPMRIGPILMRIGPILTQTRQRFHPRHFSSTCHVINFSSTDIFLFCTNMIWIEVIVTMMISCNGPILDFMKIIFYNSDYCLFWSQRQGCQGDDNSLGLTR